LRILSPRKSPLRVGRLVYIVAPAAQYKHTYQNFIRRNEDYHKPWVYHSFDLSYFDQYLTRIKRGVTQGFFVFENDTGNLVGVININNILLGTISSASLGYYGDKDYAGRGHMTEGMMLALDYAVADLGLHRLEANIQPDNIPSLKFVKNIGFRREGFSPKYLKIGGKWRDHERWAILDEDIPSKKNHT